MTYEPPTIPIGSTSGEYELAPGVWGYAVEHDGLIYIPLISATYEGSGDVGRFLDSLSERCRIPNVVSVRMLGMLKRRGWQDREELTNDGPMLVWSRSR